MLSGHADDAPGRIRAACLHICRTAWKWWSWGWPRRAKAHRCQTHWRWDTSKVGILQRRRRKGLRDKKPTRSWTPRWNIRFQRVIQSLPRARWCPEDGA